MNLSERRAPTNAKIEEVPDPDSPAAADLKTPIPYRRIKPEYTSTAFLYDLRTTIDIEAEVDSDGRVMPTRIIRWVGFGLEESVENAVRSVNCDPRYEPASLCRCAFCYDTILRKWKRNRRLRTP